MNKYSIGNRTDADLEQIFPLLLMLVFKTLEEADSSNALGNLGFAFLSLHKSFALRKD
jgi:hypothetical protein